MFRKPFAAALLAAALAITAGAARHTHPGIETGYVLEGESELAV